MTDEPVVPEGWSATTLGKLGRYLNGRAFKTSEWSKSGRPIIRIQDLTGTNRNPNFFDGEVQDRYVVRPGDFLISWSATLGAYIWEGPEAVLNQHIFKVESFIDKRFHYHLVRNSIAELERNAHGSGMVHVTKGIFDSTPVVMPDDPERQRLLAQQIDYTDERYASSAGHLLKAKSAISQFKRALLADAYRRAQGPEETPTLVELESILRSPLKNGYSARPVSHRTPFRVLTLTATTSGYFDDQQFKFTDEPFDQDSPFWLSPGDIVVQRGNTTEYVGVPALYEGEAGTFLYPDLMIRIQVQGAIDPRFVWYMLMAPQARQYLRERATGSAGNMPKINQQILYKLPVPVPDESSRSAIVEQLDKGLSLAAKVEARIASAQIALDRGPQAVLSRAFSVGLAA
jgi:type I restriction enzyme S subunit